MSRPQGKHRARVLSEIRPGAASLRADLVRTTGLSAATVARVARDLIGGKVLREVRLAPSSVGRPSTGLQINGGCGAVVGVSALPPVACLALLDLSGKLLHEVEQPLDWESGAEAILGSLRSALARLLKRLPAGIPRLRGVGLALPGQWDRAAGVCNIFPRVPDWKDVPIRKLLMEWTRLPAWLVGYAPSLAVAEQAQGEGQEAQDLLCVEVADNIALGAIANGQVLEGISGNAGELGHIAVEPRGLPCYCGSRGCLETVATCRSIEDASKKTTYEEVVARARRGNGDAVRLLSEAATALGRGLGAALNLFNPKLLVLRGRFFDAGGELVLTPLTKSIQGHALLNTVRPVEIRRSALGAVASAYGAGITAVRRVIQTL
jgi:predicted NBD/HSP70 family sugar kinase